MSKTPRPYLIEWDDSMCPGGVWKDSTSAVEWATETTMRCVSVGFILKEDRQCLTIYGDMTDDVSSVGRLMKIPRVAVKRKKRL